MQNHKIPGFRNVARTGVIYVMARANEQGYHPTDSEWANLGQGSPETGDMGTGAPRLTELTIHQDAYKYSPIAGNLALREQVARHYNQLYRRDKTSQYTYENVSICGGGRQALSRVVGSLGNINMGHFLPDYTAYEELLSAFKGFTPIPILLERDQGYQISPQALQKEILGRGLSSILISNPCNPTGQVIEGDDLAAWVDVMRQSECSVIMDEFYSHYLYRDLDTQPDRMVSAARYVDDVNADPVIILNGLTKNWRYPGLRISWIVAPKAVIDAVSSAGSFLDGGANHPFQQKAIELLDPQQTIQEARTIRQVFAKKREYVIERLEAMGIRVHAKPNGAFYVWADLAGLPAPLTDNTVFFEKALAQKVIVVPGIYFDVNPSGRRTKSRRYADHIRISFGPDMATLQRGMDALQRVIDQS